MSTCSAVSANVDIKIILNEHAAMAYLAKYASKAETVEHSLKNIVKAIVTKADVAANTSTAIRSAIIRSVVMRDIGQGEGSRILMSGIHCESTLKYVHVS